MGLSSIIRRLLPLAALLFAQAGSLGAQPADRPPIMNLGDAVTTGFSGTVIVEPKSPAPPNTSVIDFAFINPDGPTARVVSIGRPGYVWDGRLLPAPKTFDVFAKDSGQVFGVALDDQAAPNIYLAATSAFGLQLVGPGPDGLPQRRKVGGPGSEWMKGQFGLDLQGDPGSIYRVDGRTGVVSLFAKVMLGGAPNPGPALGNLAYDAAHKQLFVSDLYTGMIHRFAIANGSEAGAPYDHGVTGRAAANLAPVPFDPASRPDIGSSQFNSEAPATWGFAPPERRVWGVAVHAGRLFYSARNGATSEGPQIWSVGIQPDGSFAGDPRLELEVAQPGPYPVSDIAFMRQGAMILAQRAPIAASYDYSAFTQPAEPRVLRYWPKGPNDPASPGLWKPVPDEYAVGFADQYRNTNGGVALGYGYDREGRLGTGACEAALWTTGQNLRNNPALRSQLEPGGPLVVHGLQGSPADLVRPANAPPRISYFIDYDDKFDDPAATGHLGSVRVLAQPCASGDGPPGGDIIITPPGCVGPNCQPWICTPSCICPRGTVLKNGECVRVETFQVIRCTPPMIPNVAGSACVCPTGSVLVDGRCVPQTTRCQPPLVPGPVPGSCVCPQGTVLRDRKCVPQVCPPPFVPGPCCPEGTTEHNGECVPIRRLGSLVVEKKVKNDTEASPAVINALSFQIKLVCPPSSINTTFVLQNGGTHTENNIPYGSVCTVTETGLPPPPPNACPRGSTPTWLPPVYVPPSVTISGATATLVVENELRCVKNDICPPPMVPGPVPGQCICPTGTVQVGKECVKEDPCPPGTVRKGRECVRPIVCRAPLIPNAAGTDCVCPGGLLQRGRSCVQPIVCHPPLVPNAAGSACVCPGGMLPRRGSCVQPITCRAPARPNSAGTGCTCPGNMIPQGNGCIERPRDPKLHVPERIPGIGIPNTNPRGNPEGPVRR